MSSHTTDFVFCIKVWVWLTAVVAFVISWWLYELTSANITLLDMVSSGRLINMINMFKLHYMSVCCKAWGWLSAILGCVVGRYSIALQADNSRHVWWLLPWWHVGHRRWWRVAALQKGWSLSLVGTSIFCISEMFYKVSAIDFESFVFLEYLINWDGWDTSLADYTFIWHKMAILTYCRRGQHLVWELFPSLH